MVERTRNGRSTPLSLCSKDGQDVTLVGGNGDGQTTRSPTRSSSALTIDAVVRMLCFICVDGRADPLSCGSAEGCFRFFENSRGARRAHGEADFRSGFPIALSIQRPDLGTGRRTSALGSFRCQDTAAGSATVNSCAAHGGKACDHSAMVRALEMMQPTKIGTTLGRPEAIMSIDYRRPVCSIRFRRR